MTLRIERAIRTYRNLREHLPLRCRLIEAERLFELTKSFGTEADVRTVQRILNRNDISLICECDNEDCDCWSNEESACLCLDYDTFDCWKLYVFGELPTGEAIRAGRES